ncbi:TPA: ATP-dependent DNA helicase, partial [Staphylococcus aureus]
FSTSYPVVCLSATITNKTNNENSYEYIKEIIGFKGYEEDIKYNDFPYKESRLYIPPNLPKFDKRDVKYYEEIGKHIFELASQNKGGTLILFTAKDDIDGVYNDLSKRKFNKTIYVDDGSKSQNEIIESFKKTKGVILGTGVFWEGIDLKNELLTLLVIVRLPFPTIDPITKYKITKLNDSNEAVIVPEMIIKLKQGVGRLVRTKQDKGLLVLLDSRMNKPIYKHKEAVLDALPIKNMIHKDEVKDFLNNI